MILFLFVNRIESNNLFQYGQKFISMSLDIIISMIMTREGENIHLVPFQRLFTRDRR